MKVPVIAQADFEKILDGARKWLVESKRNEESAIVTKEHILKPPFSIKGEIKTGLANLTISGKNDSLIVRCNRLVASPFRKGQLALLIFDEDSVLVSGRVLASLTQSKQAILDAFPPGKKFTSEQLYAKIQTKGGESQRHARRRWKELKYDYGFDVDFDGKFYWRGKTDVPVREPALRPDDSKIREAFLDILAKESTSTTGDNLPLCKYCDARVTFKDSAFEDAECDDTGLLDHRRPVFQGGDDSKANLQILCQTCNNKKNTVCRACPFNYKCEKCIWAFPERARSRRLVLHLEQEAVQTLRKLFGTNYEAKAAEILQEEAAKKMKQNQTR